MPCWNRLLRKYHTEVISRRPCNRPILAQMDGRGALQVEASGQRTSPSSHDHVTTPHTPQPTWSSPVRTEMGERSNRLASPFLSVICPSPSSLYPEVASVKRNTLSDPTFFLPSLALANTSPPTAEAVLGEISLSLRVSGEKYGGERGKGEGRK